MQEEINQNQITKQLQRIEDTMLCVQRTALLAAKNVLTIEDVAILTGLSKWHIYKLTSEARIPHYKPNARLLYFNRKEIEEWMQRNRVIAQDEARQHAAAYCISNNLAK